ncbi:hypothetical protein L6Q96_13300 [Candidatus Binatia bacterium]|nr:hypothetical protein [Candidatus Binatia bacterium]
MHIDKRLRIGPIVAMAAMVLAGWQAPCGAVPIDKEGDIKLGVRSYANARIGTTGFHETFLYETASGARTLRWRNWSFPPSPAGHLRQNRYFLEAELDHSLDGLVKRGVGPLALLDLLPFRISGLKYHLTYRGEWESIYDWGPKEFSTADAWHAARAQRKGLSNPATGTQVDIGAGRRKLRSLASQRNRLFQWYVEGTAGPVFMRFGRQIVAWGETDGFRLLDNINPLDSSFGGFLISLDERRVPLDMLRVQYAIGSIGPLTESFLEFYGAIDNKVSYVPGTPAGSPWSMPNAAPEAGTLAIGIAPTQNFSSMRGGGRLVFNYSNATFSLAHYYTFLDTPAVQSQVRPKFPLATPTDPKSPQSSFPNGASAMAFATAPTTQITGGSVTFAVPSLYTVVRSELAYFNNEPRFSQFGVDPFMYAFYFRTCQGGSYDGQACTTNAQCGGAPCGETLTDCRPTRKCFTDRARVFGAGNNPTGGRRLGDSFNFVVGIDANQYIRWLNPNQTFFFSTQFFYKHLLDALPRRSLPGRVPLQGEVLPVAAAATLVPRADLRGFGAVEPNLIHQPTDTFLHTFFVGTAYMGGKLFPGIGFFYDWGGAYTFQPSLTLSRDPFRFVVDYSLISAHTLKGGSGLSLLQDRDNVQFRLEYVI